MKITYSGGGFSSLLLVAFIVLKIIGVITWSWWWVLSPIWIPIMGVIVIGIIVLLYIMIKAWKKNLL